MNKCMATRKEKFIFRSDAQGFVERRDVENNCQMKEELKSMNFKTPHLKKVTNTCGKDCTRGKFTFYRSNRQSKCSLAIMFEHKRFL